MRDLLVSILELLDLGLQLCLLFFGLACLYVFLLELLLVVIKERLCRCMTLLFICERCLLILAACSGSSS